MSKLTKFQDVIRNNGKELTGVDVPVTLSNEQTKHAELTFTFGWKIEIGVNSHNHGGRRPSGVSCGSSSQASQQAHDAAKQYISGQDPLFNERFIKILGPDIRKNFLIRNTNLQSGPDTYVGADRCERCHGRGDVRCNSCFGTGKTSCFSCHGSGRISVSKYDNYSQRTIYTTESCSTCYGSGKRDCSMCYGRGHVKCNPCEGGGYIYFSYSIDGQAKRSSKWNYSGDDYHAWTGDFIKSYGLDVIHELTEVTEIDSEKSYDGCTFIYAFSATLTTLQFTASLDKIDTKICFAGVNYRTHDAGGIYDPAVWQVAKSLGAGDKEDDVQALATPAIKTIIEAQWVKTTPALLSENWVSKAIKDAVLANYDTLVGQLKQQSVRGIIPSMCRASIKYAYWFFCLGMVLALFYPQFAELTDQRMGLMEYPNWLVAVLRADFGLFGLPPLANYGLFLGLLWLSYQLIKRFYWKILGPKKTLLLALACTLLLPHVGLSLYYNGIEISQHSPRVANGLAGGSILMGLYLLVLGFSWPSKWYLKPIGLVLAAAMYVALQFGLMTLYYGMKWVPEDMNYLTEMGRQIQTSFEFIRHNLAELSLVTLVFSYLITRRRFWLNAKSAVAEYHSPVLLKSMNMER